MVLISLIKRKRYYSPKLRSSNSVQQLERLVFTLPEHWAALQPFIGFLAVGLIIAPGGLRSQTCGIARKFDQKSDTQMRHKQMLM